MIVCDKFNKDNGIYYKTINKPHKIGLYKLVKM